jgi:hypothetical protein
MSKGSPPGSGSYGNTCCGEAGVGMSAAGAGQARKKEEGMDPARQIKGG